MSDEKNGKKFHLGDLLSVTTERLLSPRHIDGVYDILNFMTGDELFTHQLKRANDECKPYLVKQFPQFSCTEMNPSLAELDDALKSNTSDAKNIVADWLAKQVVKYGEMFTVKPIPTNVHKINDQITEILDEMSGTGKIIVVKV